MIKAEGWAGYYACMVINEELGEYRFPKLGPIIKNKVQITGYW